MRKLVIALMVLIIVVGALLGWALYNIDSVVASYKDRIIKVAEQRTGRKIAFDRINIKLRGGIGVRIRDFSMAEAPSFGAGRFLRASEVHVDFGLDPLRREVSVTRVVFQRPEIRVIRNAKGLYNFSELAQRLSTVRPSGRPGGFHVLSPAHAADGPNPGQPPAILAGLIAIEWAVARVAIVGGTLDYRDQKDRYRTRFEKLDLELDGPRMDRPFEATLAAAFLSEQQNLRFSGVIGPLAPSGRIGAVPVDASLEISKVSWGALQRTFPRIEKAWPVLATLTGTLESRKLSLKGSLEEMAVSGALDLTASGFKIGNALNKSRGTVFRLEADARVTAEGIVAKQLTVELEKLRFTGHGDLEFGKPAALDLSLGLAESDLAAWHRWVPVLREYALSGFGAATAKVTGKLGAGAVPRVRGTVVLRKASARVAALDKPLEALSGTVEFSRRGVIFRQLSLRIGQTRLKGSAALKSFDSRELDYRLASPSFRFADLQLQPAGTVLEEARSDGRLNWTKGLKWNGTLNSARGKFLGLDVTNVSARFGIGGSRLAMETLRLKTLGGSLALNGGMELASESPRFEVAARVRGVDITDYLEGIAGLPELEGTINADLKAKGQGRTWDAIKPNLTGTGKAAVIDGRILDFNLAERALRGVTGLQGLTSLFNRNIKEKYPHIFKKQTSTFEQIDTEVRAVGGRVVVKRITLRARDYDIAGKGWIALDGDTNLEGVLTVSRGLSSDLLPGARLTPITNEEGQIDVPFTIRGTIPKVRLQPRVRLIQTLLEKSVGKGLQGLLDLIPGGRRGAEEFEQEPGKKPGGDPSEESKDPIRELIERGLELFGGKP